MSSIAAAVEKLGTLRVMLLSVLALLTVLAPFALETTGYEGWALASTVIVPALVPIFFFVSLLDLLMSAIYRSSSDGDIRDKYQLVIKVEVVFLMMMMGAWMPLFWGVLNPQ
ncbi:hypothetical protein ACYVVI_03535 [Arenicellales bacterium IMCC57338]